MKTMDAYATYEEFEADMVRELGLTMSIERLREIGMMTCRRRSVVAPQNSTPTLAPVIPVDFASRYSACQTPAERRAFVRANKAEARQYLRTHHETPFTSSSATAKASSGPSGARAASKLIRRKLK
jgi:hypothetical protein